MMLGALRVYERERERERKREGILLCVFEGILCCQVSLFTCYKRVGVGKRIVHLILG